MFEGVTFHTLRGADLAEIQLQKSQQTVLGMPGGVAEELYPLHTAGPVAWAVRSEGRLICCFGIVEQFEGRHGFGWALLAEGLGSAHLALTRFVRSQVTNSGLARVEALVRGPDLEAIIAERPQLDPGQILAIALSVATPEMRWAMQVGLTPVHVMRCYGANGESVVLCERISAPASVASIEREAA